MLDEEHLKESIKRGKQPRTVEGRESSVRCDIRNEAQVDSLVGQTLDRFGRVTGATIDLDGGEYMP